MERREARLGILNFPLRSNYPHSQCNVNSGHAMRLSPNAGRRYSLRVTANDEDILSKSSVRTAPGMPHLPKCAGYRLPWSTVVAASAQEGKTRRARSASSSCMIQSPAYDIQLQKRCKLCTASCCHRDMFALSEYSQFSLCLLP
jgi:hypothetical protein